MKRTPLTPKEESYIKENRLKKSMIDMAKEINRSYNHVRDYMHENQLQLTKQEIRAITSQKIKSTHRASSKREVEGPKWTPEPWKYGLNLITMMKL